MRARVGSKLSSGGSGILAALLLLVLAVPASSQTGAVSGRVTDLETGQPVAGANVEVLGAGAGAAGGQLTGNDGQFRLSLPPGTYSIVVSLIGYQPGRYDGVQVASGGTTSLNVALRSQALLLNPVVVTASRREEKALDAPASVTLVGTEQIRARAATTVVDHVRSVPGVDVAQTGIQQSNVVARGFNNVFSGGLLAITDNRYANVPSLRVNVMSFVPSTDLDLERIEVVLGPGAALYGPNSAGGVLHMITSSPIDRPGTSVSVAGGERSLFHSVFRTAVAPSETFGFKVSGQYFRGRDWEYSDPTEVAARAAAIGQGASPASLKIGARDFDALRYGVDARMDFRPGDDTEIIVSGGLSNAVSQIEMTGIGTGQADNWTYSYAQARYRSGRFFAQGFMNRSDAGDTYLLRTGAPIVDRSTMLAGQLQHGFDLGERQSFIYGLDLQRTEPRTEGTINGRNEDDDIIDEVGGYLHSETRLSDRFSFVAAVRVDSHSRLEEPNVSPRAALVFKPAENQNFRLTFNRAFSTPTTNNLFLDLLASRIPISGPIGYDIRTRGVPSTGFTFDRTCQGGVSNRCMRTPFAPGQELPANAAVLWNGLVNSLVPASLRTFLANPGSQPGDPVLGTVLRRLDTSTGSFVTDPGIEAIDPIRSTITNTFEIGYKGVLGEKVLLSADFYRSQAEDFVGPLRVETPNVFYDPASLQAYVLKRLTPLIQAGALPQAQAVGLIETFARLPVGTITADQADTPDLMLTYRNFGDIEYWGMDLAAQVLATERVSLAGNWSFVSQDCFLFSGGTGDSCSSALDIALNAPKSKGSVSLRFDDPRSGLSLEGRTRFSAGFPMNSGVFVGDIEGHTLFDANVSWQLPGVSGARVTLTGTNLFDSPTRYFIGAPEIGRLMLVRMQYDF